VDERICLITGATSGIGRVTARELARRGMRVVLVGRDAARAEATATAIARETGSSAVEYLVADLSAQAQVHALADSFRQRHERLHVLVNDAGAVFAHREVTVDGLERTLALNHLAPFLLTNLLLETLQASGPARIVTVASAAHNGATLNFADLQHVQGAYRPFQVYGQSKLANILFTYELARRLQGTSVTANTLHPGFVSSNFGKSEGGLWKPLFTLLRPFMIGVERGAQTSVYVASSPEVEGTTGQYFVKSKPARSSRQSYDESAQHRLWDVSARLAGLSGVTAATASF
jgi:NAD(P)-dependent dehydrogenase (short-subunit alcohol dehydrogenase family)